MRSYTRGISLSRIITKHSWILDESHVFLSYHSLLRDFRCLGNTTGMKRYLALIERARVLHWWLWEMQTKSYFDSARLPLRTITLGFRSHSLLDIFLEKILFQDSFYSKYLGTSNLIFIVQSKHCIFYFSGIRFGKTSQSKLDIFP